jgi:tRNA 2-thiouridine synthesizing protein A
MIDYDETLDAIGLLCPLPVLKTQKRLKSLSTGAVLRVLADDPAAVLDMQHFCAESGHAFVGHSDQDAHQVYLIRKK